jgi:hypothetical protein
MARIKQRTQRIELSFLGPEWAEGYIEAKRLHWRDLEAFNSLKEPTNAQAEAALITALQEAFVAGQAPGESGQLIELTRDDLADFDIDAQTQLYAKIQGDVSPNG